MSERYEYAVMARSARPNMDGSTVYLQVVDRTFRLESNARNAADRHPNPDVVVCKRRVTEWEEVSDR
ncbi:hypothetical protein [Tsukamurella sp. NPDC003166]|uniref:hypothetical protein n=1 Tax=Tsukamurella sp. NPDC003166 TaxID=3154444 RepID=UPI0033B947F5